MALDEPGVGTIRGVAAGRRSCSETLDRQEVGPACLPAA